MAKFQQLGESRLLNLDNLPREILIEFLIRLPVLDLTRASLTCKTWYLIISNSEFVVLHLKRSAKRLGYLYSFDSKFENFLASSTINNKRVEVQRIIKGGLRDGIHTRMNSAGGLLAYTIEKVHFCYICNPFTGEEIKVPKKLFCGKGFGNNWCGLGYSVTSKEYKILLLASQLKGDIISQHIYKGAIYTLGAGSEWRELPGNIPFRVCTICRPLDFEGSLFFLVTRNGDLNRTICIASFDVESETFRFWNSPDTNMHVAGPLYFRLLSIGGAVAFAEITPMDDTGVSIWMLRDKVNEIWVKEINIKVQPPPDDPQLRFRMNIFGECATSNNSQFPCILLSVSDELFVYDTGNKSLKEVFMPRNRDGEVCKRAKCIAHIESFVSPKRIMNVAASMV